MAVDETKLNEFMGKFVGDLGAVMHAATIVVGDSLGLYKALAHKPATAEQLAKSTQTDARYLREWLASRGRAAENMPDAAERRRMEWERRKQRRWAFASTFTCTAVILILAAEFAYTRVTATPEARSIQSENGEVRIPLAEISDPNLHIYNVDASGTSVRFLVIRKPNGSWGTALDACLICGTAGYRQDGSNVVCRNCASAIYIPTIGEAGGCNPVGVPSHADNGALVIDVSKLAEARSRVSK